MLSPRSILLIANTLLLCNTAFASPRSNPQFTHSNTWKRAADAPDTTVLEPVVPPEVDETLLSNLAPAIDVSLAWAGAGVDSAPGGSARRIMKRDSALLARADFVFKYPAITLDHSAYVSGVSCSDGVLTGTLTEKAYAFAKKQWPGNKNMVFVTAADSCGPTDADDYFHATSIVFTDGARTFSAKGASHALRIDQVTSSMTLQWGDIGMNKLKRSVTKREMFEPHPLHKRIEKYVEKTFTWGHYLHNEDYLGTDKDAPWKNAAKLIEWKKAEGKADDSYKKGEVANKANGGHHKRSNETSIAVRGETKTEFDYGMALYCVECGFGGRLTAWGYIRTDWLTVEAAQLGLKGTMDAGLYLGLNAYMTYDATWTSQRKEFYFVQWGIPGIATIGPKVAVALEAKFGVKASGQLLLGAGVDWSKIDIMLDMVNPSNSRGDGLIPDFKYKAEAQGELSMHSSLGLPVFFGIGISILDALPDWLGGELWKAEAGILDTPSINLEGKFEVSAKVNDNGVIEYDINGGCYGIAWNVYFMNTLEAVISAKYIGEFKEDIIDPWKSDPIFEGCIGYVDDGTDEGLPDKNPESPGTGSGVTGKGHNIGGSNGISGSNGVPGNGGWFYDEEPEESSGTQVVQAAAAPQAKSSSTTTTSSAQTSSTTSVVRTSSTTSSAARTSSTTSKTSSTTPAVRTSSTTSSAARTSSTTSKTTPRTTSSTTKSSSTTTKSVTTTRSSTTTTKSACTPSTKVLLTASPIPRSITCKKVLKTTLVNTANKPLIGNPVAVANADLCATNCLKNPTCLSFSFNDKKFCQLYNKDYKNLVTNTRAGAPELTFYDRTCYVYNTCPK